MLAMALVCNVKVKRRPDPDTEGWQLAYQQDLPCYLQAIAIDTEMD